MGLEILVVLVVQYLAQGDQVVQDLPLVLSILKPKKFCLTVAKLTLFSLSSEDFVYMSAE